MRNVAETKITVPELLPDLVERPVLLRELDRVVDVGLVCAPAGYGKTMLLAEWAHATTGVDTAWVRIDRDDDDPRHLWSAVLAAMARCESLPPSSPLRVRPTDEGWDLPSAGGPEFLAELIESLAALRRPLRVVLDDVHEVTDPATLRGIGRFLRDRPRYVTLVLAGRLDPPLNLQRLRPQGRLTELRGDRLRFDRLETEALLGRTNLHLTPAQLDHVHRQTDGWPAGVRLAAVAMARTSDIDEFLADFSGDERSIADYLVGEVLSGLPADTVQLLQLTSICEALPVSLAVALSGREDAGRVLAELEHQTALVHVDGPNRDSYLVHPLIRTYLLADLNRQSRRRIARLHATAAQWCCEQSRLATALEHAAQSDEPALLTEMVRRHAVPLLVTGEHRPLRRALRASGPQVVASDPGLSVVAALVGHEIGDSAACEAAAWDAQRTWPDDPPAGLAVLRAAGEELGALPVAPCGVTRPASPASLPDNDAVPAEPELEALVRLAHCAGRLRRGDDVRAVRRAIDRVLAEARSAGFDYLSLLCLTLAAAAAGIDGDLRTMRKISAEACALASGRRWQASPWAIGSSGMLAYGNLLVGKPDEAGRLAAEALAHCAKATPRLRFVLAAIEGAAVADQGDRARGIDTLGHARIALGETPASRIELAAAAMAEFDAAVRIGRYAAARTTLSWLAERTGETAEAYVMRARCDVAAGRYGQARATLRRVLDERVPALLPSTLVDALLQETVLAVHAGDRFAAHKALHAAIERAEPLDLFRPFVHAGPVVRELLAQRYGSREAADTFGWRALAMGRQRGDGLDAVLSHRELAVLAMLPSLQSLDEIAADLTISVNTVKSHVRSIYSKLGVSSRRSAVLTAYEHGLIVGSAHAN
jgi:LuxR family transcriptional regulator, maltose regulon positive regulatory protein